MAELPDILKAAVAQKASDIFLVPGQPPTVRRAGQLAPLPGFPSIDAREAGRMIMSTLYEEQRRALQESLELDCTLSVPDLARFRMNVTTALKGLHAVLHPIPAAVPTPEEIGLPEAVAGVAALPRGLVLVTGPVGSGKSTTLASLIEKINKTRDVHIVTIEELIEFHFAPKSALICQRELGTHIKSRAAALRAVLKQNADVVLAGEISDKDTAEEALHIAESGPLVFGTLPTKDSMHTIERIVNMFPLEQHRQIQLRLASTLKAAISQVLLPRSDGKGYVAAREIMIMNPAIESAIREGKTPQIYSAIDGGAKQGMVNLDKAILQLVRAKTVTFEAALEKCNHPDTLQSALAALR